MLLGTLGASLLGNMLAGKGMLRAGYGSKKILIPPHPRRNFEIKNIVKMNQGLMEFFQKLIYLRK